MARSRLRAVALGVRPPREVPVFRDELLDRQWQRCLGKADDKEQPSRKANVDGAGQFPITMYVNVWGGGANAFLEKPPVTADD